MKKYIIALVALLLMLALSLTVFAVEVATSEISPSETTENEGVAVGGGSEETPAVEEYAGEGWFETAKSWVLKNLSGIVLSIFGVYLAIPKVGGIATVKKALAGLTLLVGAIKKYIDDKNNPNSLVNKMDNLGELLAKGMNDRASTDAVSQTLMAEVRDVLQDVRKRNSSEEQTRAVLLAVEEGLELMAKEFSDLISISTTITQKKKAEFDEAWMLRIAHLRETVRGALGNDDKAEKEIA